VSAHGCDSNSTVVLSNCPFLIMCTTPLRQATYKHTGVQA
jgi:hypothetical protein